MSKARRTTTDGKAACRHTAHRHTAHRHTAHRHAAHRHATHRHTAHRHTTRSHATRLWAACLQAALCALLIALIATLLCGCGASQPPAISPIELAEAKSFPYYTLYWVGETFANRRLTAADGVEGYKPKDGDSIYYGDCVSSESILGSGCLLPLKVTTAIYALHSNLDLGPQRNTLLRGVPAVIFNEGRSIELYTGRLMIDVYSDTPASALAAVKLLQPINAPRFSSVRLPPPVYCPWLTGMRPLAERALLMHLPGAACELFKAALSQSRALKHA
jgi:hypothetical protein